MAFPTGWGRRCALVIQSSKVTDTETNFPTLITKDTLPSEMFDADGSYPAINGGGDIRFSSDSAGNTQFACEIERFVTDNDPANGKAEIWVKVPSLASVSNTTIYVWYNKSGEVQPVEGAAYGKHAVWDTNYKLVQHMNQDPSGGANCMIDSTSNNNDGTPGGTMVTGDLVDSKIGKGIDFDGSNDYIEFSSISLPSDLTVSGWMKFDSGTVDSCLTGGLNSIQIWRDEYSADRFAMAIYVSGWQVRYGSVSPDTTNYYYVTITFNDTSDIAKLYTNGSQDGADLSISPLNLVIERVGAGDRSDVKNMNGKIDEFRVSNTTRSAGWIETEYNNQSDPATFIIEGTPETPSGGTLRELVTTIASTTVLSSASTNVLREITVVVGTTTTTTAQLKILREMSAAIASVTATAAISASILREIQTSIATSVVTSTSDLLLLREISAALSITTTTSTSTLNVLREINSIIASTTISTANLNILRELISTINIQTALSEIELLLSGLIELTTTIGITTSTSNINVNILRELITSIDTLTDLSAIELLILILRELTTTIAINTSTNNISVNILRELITSIDTETDSKAILNILREIISIISIETDLSDIELLTLITRLIRGSSNFKYR